MSHSPAPKNRDNGEEIVNIANDLDVTASTISSLVRLAERTLAEEAPGIETLIQVTARYAADLVLISQRLFDLNKQ